MKTASALFVKSCGMTGSGCRFMRNVSSEDVLSGPRRRTARQPSQALPWPVCSKVLTGETPNRHGARRRSAKSIARQLSGPLIAKK